MSAGRAIRAASGDVRGERTPELFRVVDQPSGWSAFALNLCKLFERLIALLVRHPVVTVLLASLGFSLVTLGVIFTVLALAGLGLLALAWRLRWPGSFARLVACPLRSWWRQMTCYGRHWQPAMVTCGLTKLYGASEFVPSIKKVIAGKSVDRVLVQMLAGQAPKQWEPHAEAFAHTFAALRCQIRVADPGRLWLHFFHHEPLDTVVAALPVPASPDFMALPLGITETMEPWLFRLSDTHTLIIGQTGSGKSHLAWGILRACGNGIRTGTVTVWGIDPKRRELRFCPGLFTRLEYQLEAMLTLLEDAVTEMHARADATGAQTRVHVPSVEQPLLIVVVDERAALIAYGDTQTRRRAKNALQLLLSQGRASGVVVIALAQDASKEVIEFRDLFPARICLAVTDAQQVDMALGRGARARGAECDLIPAPLPGVGYVVLDGVREPIRVRAGHITDQDLADMTRLYAPGRPDPASIVDTDQAPSGLWSVPTLQARDGLPGGEAA